MSARTLRLVAPNDLPVQGFLLENGSICKTEFTYDSATKVCYFKLIDRTDSEFVKQDGQNVMVDSAGNHWSCTDVEYHSILLG